MPELLEILGQDAALAQLQRLARSDRRPHAFVFAGPEGVGRRTTAVEFARLLLCERPVEHANAGRLAELPGTSRLTQACGQCLSCKTISAGTHPDLHMVYRQLARFHEDAKVRGRVMQDLGIDVIRQFLIAPAYRASSTGRGKVFIVREAELMSDAAQNALLKTLEEPPEGVTIIMTCTSVVELLPTTRSRCQPIRFGPLPPEFVAEMLTADGVDPAEARFWAGMTEGSAGRAQRLAEEDLYEFKQELVRLLAELTPAGAATLAELLQKAMEKLGKRRQSRDENLAATLANRQAGQMLLGLISSVYRDAVSLSCGADKPLTHADQGEAIATIAARFDPEPLADILAQLARYEQLLWRNLNPKLLWDNVAVTCATAAPLEV
ncbi:MAG: DNA polymerase III subunit [Planctomycetota bacterium]|jgi:DNA polymerase-3 subunit delta'